jgi:hypothetical protein
MSSTIERPESRLSSFAWNFYGAAALLFFIACVTLAVAAEVFDFSPDLGSPRTWPSYACIFAVAGTVTLLTALGPLVILTNRAKWFSVAAGVASTFGAWFVVGAHWYDALGMGV